MGRFVVFDQETIGKLPQDLRVVAELRFGLYSRDTLDYLQPILEANSESLIMIPAKDGGVVCMMHLRPVPKPQVPLEEPTLPSEPEYEATGFLGLSDSVYAVEPKPRRRWWHWFWS
jgi:hypothetical protein